VHINSQSLKVADCPGAPDPQSRAADIPEQLLPRLDILSTFCNCCEDFTNINSDALNLKEILDKTFAGCF
jgi:hypothetical protein